MEIAGDKTEGERWMLLAPVVSQRKGEHIQLLEDLQAQGFIRVRIDGVVYELDELPELDGKKKHNIEVIIDRFKIRQDIKLRLAESFETALRIAP
jgi:excinuclease ABC subunit A